MHISIRLGLVKKARGNRYLCTVHRQLSTEYSQIHTAISWWTGTAIYACNCFMFHINLYSSNLPCCYSYHHTWILCYQPRTLIILHLLNRWGSFAVWFEAVEMCLECIKKIIKWMLFVFHLVFLYEERIFMNKILNTWYLIETLFSNREKDWYKPQKARKKKEKK